MINKKISVLCAILTLSFLSNQSLSAYYDDGPGSIIGPTLGGAAIGGLAGGRKGARIGAAVGLGAGLIDTAARRRNRRDLDYYDYDREIRALERENKSLAKENRKLNRENEKLRRKLKKRNN